MSHVSDEIRSQPALWQRALDLELQLPPVLPQPGERVAVIGCGTSWFMAESYALLRERNGHGETDFWTASELPTTRGYDRLLAISRSGTTTEVLAALEQARCPTVAITADPAAPIRTAADQAIVLDFADERSVVQTVFATSTLMLLRASLGMAEAGASAIRQAEQVLDQPPLTGLDRAEQYTFLGRGWAHGIAREAALKMREAARAWTEAYPQLEYRHGPISIAQPGRVVWIFGEPVAGLLDDIRATGARIVCDELDPLADLIRVQQLAVRLAEAAGLDPDRPRHLSRSVVLDQR